VKDIRKQSNAFTGKQRPAKVTANKLSKDEGNHDSSSRNAVSSAISQEGIEDLASVYLTVRKQIATWQHSQNNIHLRQLREHREFKVIIEQRTAPTGGRFSAAILCVMCNTKVILNVSDKYVRLSNWIRHLKKCSQQKGGKQKNLLTNYFRSYSESSSPEILTPDPIVSTSASSVDSNLSTLDGDMPFTHVTLPTPPVTLSSASQLSSQLTPVTSLSASLPSSQVTPVTSLSASLPSLQVSPVTSPSASLPSSQVTPVTSLSASLPSSQVTADTSLSASLTSSQVTADTLLSGSLPPLLANLATTQASSTRTENGENNFKQDFRIAPPIVKKIGGADCDIETLCKRPKVDWSYSTRKQLSILKYDPSQTLITDYHKIIDKVERYVRASPELMSMFNVSPTDSNQASHYSYKKDIGTF